MGEQPADRRPGPRGARPRAGVDRVLGHVHVHADAEVGGEPAHRVERLVGEREARRGRRPARARPAAQEPLVLGQPGLGAVGAVAVGDLVAARRPARRPRRRRRAITSRLPSIAVGLEWWSMIAVVPASSASSAPSTRRPARSSRGRARDRARHHTSSRISGNVCGVPRRRGHAARERRVEVVCARTPAPGGAVAAVVVAHWRRGASAAARASRRRGRAARRRPRRRSGTSPISPTPLMPYGRARLRLLDEDHLDRRARPWRRMMPRLAQRHDRSAGRRRRTGSPR